MTIKVIIVHNSYQIPGGEDSVFLNEVQYLEDMVDVFSVQVNNASITTFMSKIIVSIETIFSFRMYFKFKRLFKEKSPDIVHVHNYFPKISPAIFYAAKNSGIPVVHTLHNFRAICPTATLSFDGEVTEHSIENNSFWAIWKRVYRNSFFGTFILSLMIEFHKRIGTWDKCVDGYIALTDFSRDIYIRAGWPVEKLFVKPNFSVDPGRGGQRQNYALYVGRLSNDKGVDFILNAFYRSGYGLKVAGGGELAEAVSNIASSSSSIEYLGSLNKQDVLYHMQNASCLVMASTWFEGFPMVIVEALAAGLPIVVPRLGNMAAVVKDEVTGLHYTAKNEDQFSNCIARIMYEPSFRNKLSENARKEYLELYSESVNRDQLLEIYMKILGAINVKEAKR